MIEFNAKVKKWGNSMGIVLPKDIVKERKFKSNQMIRVALPPQEDTAEWLWNLLDRKVSKEEGKQMTESFMRQRQEDRAIEKRKMEKLFSLTRTHK